jgi:hypothetical protein
MTESYLDVGILPDRACIITTLGVHLVIYSYSCCCTVRTRNKSSPGRALSSLCPSKRTHREALLYLLDQCLRLPYEPFGRRLVLALLGTRGVPVQTGN